MLKIFLVDDEPFILDGLQTIIKWAEYGMKITGQAMNGADALSCLSENPADILITDITMPLMNGLELIRNVRQISPDTRFIVLSGYSDFEFVREGIMLGIENYLLKPLNVHELISTLQNTALKIRKSSIIETYIKKDREILRDNILYRWVTNSIDPVELSERAELLDINLGYSYYSVSILKVMPDPDGNINHGTITYHHAIYEAFRSCRALVEKSGSGICFCDLDGDIVIISSTNCVNKRECGIHILLERICTGFRNNPGTSFIATCGSMQPGSLNVYISYENAKKLQEYSLVCSNSIVDYEDVIKTPAVGEIELDIDYNSLSIMLVTGKRDEVSEFIRSTFDKLTGIDHITPGIIVSYSMEMISHINETVNEFNRGGKKEEWNYRNLISGLSSLQTIAQLKKYIQDAAFTAISLVSPVHVRMSPVIRQALNYVNTHYHEEIGLKALGQMLKINPVYLGQLFQKETGELFTDYVNRLKMKKAREMLLNSNMKVAEVSQRVGFCNANYFCTQFKKYIGFSPSELRELQNI
ncbi:MAG TPA: response regulator transcription factor [Ruminiclostridium sp.]|nr:response regulator transcription factor [Ruminiclostridium sp.]